MTIEEKVKEAESLIAKANELLKEVKEEKENITNKDILTEYWNDIETKDAYYLNSFSHICRCDATECPNVDRNDFSTYPSREYAEQAQQLKEFNDKLLAFKWCYDKEYEPIFDNDYCNTKYAIYYDSIENKYVHDYTTAQKYNLIYFSSKKIAQKCCDWLNSVEDENKNE